jgi:hypothetical protein
MNNIDIVYIHNLIQRKYQNKNENINDYLKWKNLYNNVVDNKASSEVIKDIENKLKECELSQDDNQFCFYLIRAIPLIDEFKKAQKKQNKIYFFNKDNKENKNEDNELIHQILNNYLNLVQNYFPEDYKNLSCDKMKITQETESFEKMEKQKCQICNNELDKFLIYDNHFVCENCGFVSNTTHSNISYKDIDRVNLSSKYTYDRRSHFRDTINQFQGKQNANIPKAIYDSLIEQFVLHGIVSENYKSLSKEEAFKNVTKEHIILFLKEIKHTKHYEDVTLLHYQITGKPTPNIGHLENQLLNDFDQLIEVYDKKFKHLERKNFINTQYVLYQLLKRHKYSCKKEDFNMLKTVDRKYYHDTICSELFQELGWSFTALF